MKKLNDLFYSFLQVAASTDAQVINASDPRVALPIPQSEIDANPNIVQNKRNQQEKGEWH